MTNLRTAAQQALEALEYHVEQTRPIDKTGEAIAALRAALEQQAKPTVKESLPVEPTVAENATTQQQIEQTPPSDYRRGYWDGFNIGKREGRIEAEDELAKQAEPVEPVAWVLDGTSVVEFDRQTYHDGPEWTPLYTAPPQRKPLTDEEIKRLVSNDMVQFARAIERAHGITP